MKKTALLTLLCVAVGYPVAANAHRTYRHHGSHERTDNRRMHSRITCDMVRTYVAQLGLEQARAMAQAAGMTPSEQRLARRCLADRV
jgi:hypothetical protein